MRSQHSFYREIRKNSQVATVSGTQMFHGLTLLHLERPKLNTVLAFLSAIGLRRTDIIHLKAATFPFSFLPHFLKLMYEHGLSMT